MAFNIKYLLITVSTFIIWYGHRKGVSLLESGIRNDIGIITTKDDALMESEFKKWYWYISRYYPKNMILSPQRMMLSYRE